MINLYERLKLSSFELWVVCFFYELYNFNEVRSILVHLVRFARFELYSCAHVNLFEKVRV